MKKNTLAVALVAVTTLAGTLTSCGNNGGASRAENVVAANDFESMDGWAPANPSITREKAHSGHYSARINQAVEFSAGYTNLLGSMSSVRMQKLTVKAWGLRSGGDAKASLVVQVVNPVTGASLYWQALDVTTQVTTLNRWTEVSKTFDIPATLGPTEQMRIYLWRTGSQAVYLDDIALIRE